MGPLIAITGSIDSTRSYEPPICEHVRASTAAEELGRELAVQGCSIAVYSARTAFIEASVVGGYVASGVAQPGSIHVYSRFGRDDDFPEIEEFGELFDIHPEAAADWEVGYYSSLLMVDAVLIIGGGRGAFAAGMLALSRRIALAPVATFGGAAEKIWRCFSKERCFANEDDIALLAARWHPGSAADIVTSLIEVFQRCRSRVRTAAAIDVIRFGLHRALRKIRQDFRRATPLSTGARALDSARLTVCWVSVSSPPAGRLAGVVTHAPAPM